MTSTRAALTARRPEHHQLTAVPSVIADVVDRQSGIVSRRQLRTRGITVRDIETAVDARRWQTLGRNVVIVHNGPLSPEQHAWAAVLLPSKPAALAGLSAVASAGLNGFPSDVVHIVVRHDTHAGLPAWVKVHESRRFSASDIQRGPVLPRTSTARSLIDAATWSRSPRTACAILCAGVQQRLITTDRLGAELRRAGRIRHVRILHEIIGDISGGGHTLAEIDLAALARRAGLGAPRRQALRREPGGQVRYLDAVFDLPDGTDLAVEIDGAMHLKPLAWWDDQYRQNEIVIGGTPMLRFASLNVRLDADRVVDQLTRMRLAHTA